MKLASVISAAIAARARIQPLFDGREGIVREPVSDFDAKTIYFAYRPDKVFDSIADLDHEQLVREFSAGAMSGTRTLGPKGAQHASLEWSGAAAQPQVDDTRAT